MMQHPFTMLLALFVHKSPTAIKQQRLLLCLRYAPQYVVSDNVVIDIQDMFYSCVHMYVGNPITNS